MFGPIEGRRHDALCLGSVVLPINSEDFRHQHVIYGDPAYGLAYNIISPFCGARLTNDEQTFNTQMSRVSASVEWGFSKICQNFAYLDS